MERKKNQSTFKTTSTNPIFCLKFVVTYKSYWCTQRRVKVLTPNTAPWPAELEGGRQSQWWQSKWRWYSYFCYNYFSEGIGTLCNVVAFNCWVAPLYDYLWCFSFVWLFVVFVAWLSVVFLLCMITCGVCCMMSCGVSPLYDYLWCFSVVWLSVVFLCCIIICGVCCTIICGAVSYTHLTLPTRIRV